MKNKLFWVWISVLVIPVLTLIGAQVDINPAPSIGGGGYDLGPFLYSWLLVIIAAMWSLCTFAVAVVHRESVTRSRYLGLTGVGVVTLAAILLFYGKNLS
ncbi:hypothetical protein HRR99_16345 [Agrobacterium vaccinii]|uniref:hypothetical protein n=1 Tax=Agrobacterium vaccinii TaxID=2735528 RepID=UPI001E4A3605|nr:hypothetical protein [Agrobacterium vaccinii]UHS63178.1 hypothetical protein HRR99_16345 [Agrobacterium vaccinii]